LSGFGGVYQGRKNYAAITADLKTKDLAQRISHSLLSTSFMKFRGPEALKDRWNERAGLQRDAISSQGKTRSKRNRKETGYEEE
jgi:hypothetical protein